MNAQSISNDVNYAWMQLTDSVPSPARYALRLAEAVHDSTLTPEQTLKAARTLKKVLKKNVGDTFATHHAVIPKSILDLADMMVRTVFEDFPEGSEQQGIMQATSDMRNWGQDKKPEEEIRGGGSWECPGIHTLHRREPTALARPHS